MHGGAAGKVQRAAQTQRAVDRAQRQAGCLDLSRYTDPIDALEFVMARSCALAERLVAIMDDIPDDQLRNQGPRPPSNYVVK